MTEPRVDDDVALSLDNYCEFCDMSHEDSDYHADDGEPDTMWGDDD